MKEVEQIGRTIEEAKREALKDLGVTSEENVIFDVIDEGSEGFFGLGVKYARVRARLQEAASIDPELVIEDVLRLMNLSGTIEKQTVSSQVVYNIIGENLGILIGKHGQTLEAFQFIVNLIVNKKSAIREKIVVDVEGYRMRREKSLQDLARRLAEKAKKERRNVVMEPMLPSERRIIHLTLQGSPYVQTFSQGEEPMRKVVIAPKK